MRAPADSDAQAADDAATALDMLLVDGALGPIRRMAPGSAGLRLAADLARRPRCVARRGGALASELGQIAVGRSERAPSTRDRRFADRAWTSNPLPADAAAWRRATPGTRGSWWSDYLAWLVERGGPEKPAPTDLGGGGLLPLDPAPGAYVKDR